MGTNAAYIGKVRDDLGFSVAQLLKNPPAMQETWVQSLGWEDPMEKGQATHSSILPWRIPWTVYSLGLQSQIGLTERLSLSLLRDDSGLGAT